MSTVTLADAEARKEDYLALLKRFVEIESPTRDEAANLEVADALEAELSELGGVVARIPAPGLGVHLLARFDSETQPGGEPILVIGHMDTVHAKGTLSRLPFEVEGDRVRGPGVYDMKGGVSAALLALRMLGERGVRPALPIHFLISCDEEIGSPTSRERIEAEAKRARATLVLEPSIPGGFAKTQRKGVGGYTLTVSGVAAHAGIEPEAGASAVHELALQVGRILALAAPENGTTLNIGVMSGGTKENVVAEEATCTIDLRFWNRAEAERVDEGLKALAPSDARCALALEGGINRFALEKTPESALLYEAAERKAHALGFALGEGKSGGGSDGNLTAAVGCPTLDGLGPDGGGAHALTEHILVEDIPRRVALMAALFEGM
ncbi:MAG: M20 family metallopeptidase [Longimicrobiales bacterium]